MSHDMKPAEVERADEWIGTTVIYTSSSGRRYVARITALPKNPWHDPAYTELPTVSLEFRDQRQKLLRMARVLPWVEGRGPSFGVWRREPVKPIKDEARWNWEAYFSACSEKDRGLVDAENDRGRWAVMDAECRDICTCPNERAARLVVAGLNKLTEQELDELSDPQEPTP